MDFTSIPVIDLARPKKVVAEAVHKACKESGFFYVINHGVDEKLQQKLEALSQQFFQQDRSVVNSLPGSRTSRKVSISEPSCPLPIPSPCMAPIFFQRMCLASKKRFCSISMT
jgi:hypothetical protein